MRKLTASFLNEVMQHEAENQIQARRYERTGKRKAHRNGTRPRFAGYTHSCILYITGVPLNVTIVRYIEPSCKGSSSQEVLCLKVTLNIFPEAVVSVPLRITPPLGRVTSLLAETFKGYNSLLEQ